MNVISLRILHLQELMQNKMHESVLGIKETNKKIHMQLNSISNSYWIEYANGLAFFSMLSDLCFQVIVSKVDYEILMFSLIGL